VASLFTGAADRPDPARGVFSTLLVREGAPVDLAAHVERLERSVRELYEQELPDDLGARIAGVAALHPLQRVRVVVTPNDHPHAAVELDAKPLDAEPEPEPELLAPIYLPGGLGAHKWRDRGLLDELERATGALPLIVDLDDEVLEAATANLWIVDGTTLVTPRLDGRLLPGTVRVRVLEAAGAVGLEAREETITLERLAAADEVLLSSAIKGIRPGALADERGAGRARAAALARPGRPRFEIGARLRAALREPAAVDAG
jgi:para-aminobenzoate synthetase/4-amino-4-deoxychorismate lyase